MTELVLQRRGPYSYDDDQREPVAPVYRRATRQPESKDEALLNELTKPQQRRITQDPDTNGDTEIAPSTRSGYRQRHTRTAPIMDFSSPRPKRSKMWILWLILGGMAGLLLLQLGFFVAGWATDVSNDLHYGPTRTTVITGVFGHNGDSPDHPTSVIAINLNGSLLLEEVPAGNISKVKTYPTSVTLIGNNAAKLPVTLSIEQGSNGPNVMVQIPGQSITLTLTNSGTDFTLSQQLGG